MNVFSTYADVFIPLAVSLVTGIATFFVLREKVSRLEKDVKEVRDEVKEIRDKAIACETSLKEREPLKKSKSPVSLTDRGQRVLKDSTSQIFVDDNYAELKSLVEAKGPQTAYDIQELSHNVALGLRTDARINPIKDYAFKEGLGLDEILDILGIYLRDKILSERGINTNDIDKHDPTQTQAHTA